MKFSHGALTAAALVAVGLGAWTASQVTEAPGPATASATAQGATPTAAPARQASAPVIGAPALAGSPVQPAVPAAAPVVPTLATIAEAPAAAPAPVVIPAAAPAAPTPVLVAPSSASSPVTAEAPVAGVAVGAAPAPAPAVAAAAAPSIAAAAPGDLIGFGTGGGFCMLPGPVPPPGMWSDWNGNNTYQWYLFSPGMYIWDGTGEPANTSDTNVYTNGIPVTYSGTDAASCSYSIRYITSSGTDLDNPPTSGTLFFPGAVFSPQVAYLPITTGTPPTGSNPTYMHVIGDVLWEGAETFEVVLKNPINAALGNIRSAMVTVLDYQASTCNSNLGVAFFRFPEVRVAENGQGSPLASKTLNVTIYVQRQHTSLPPPGLPMPVTIQMIGGTAVLGTDYTLGANPFTVILPGPPAPPAARYVTAFNVALAPDDTDQDGHKTIIFQIISPNNNLVGMDIGVSYTTTGQATGVQDTCTVLIVDNESPDPITGTAPSGGLGAFGSGIDNGCGGGSGLAALAGLGLALGLWRMRRRRG